MGAIRGETKSPISSPSQTSEESKNSGTTNTGSAVSNEEASNNDFWDNIDLDWMSKPEEDLYIPVSTVTVQTEYRTSIYEQSATFYVRLKPNDTAMGLQEKAMGLSPWRVPNDKLPVLVGSLTGICLLFLMGVSLALYVCLYKRHPNKDFSVKSEASSVSSGQSQPCEKSLSRESLVLVTGPNSNHQARLLSDPSNASSFFFDYSFNFYFDQPGEDLSGLKEDRVNTYAGRSHRNPESLLQRGFSLRVAKLQKEDVGNLNKRSESGPIFQNNDSKQPIQEDQSKLTQDHEGEPSSAPHNIGVESNESIIPVRNTVNDDGQQIENKVPDVQFGHSFTYDTNSLLDESLKTRSLPAWVRSKRNRTLVCNGDFSFSMYDKKPYSKRRRNRMGSDVAQVIALSKSHMRLISPPSSVSNSMTLDREHSGSDTLETDDQTDIIVPVTEKSEDENLHSRGNSKDFNNDKQVTDELSFSESQIRNMNARNLEYQSLIKDAVIVFNERTAL